MAGRDQAGASARAEGCRAQRTGRRRRVVNAALVLVAATATAAALTTGGRWLPVTGLLAAVGAWWWRPRPDPARWHRGAEGEVATAQLLDRLPRRFVVLHDRRQLGARGNLDHVVIGPSGVWVVDSKTRRARLRIHRGHVWAGQHRLDVGPVARQAGQVQQVLGLPVTAIVAVHGTGLRGRGKKVAGVRVVPAHRLVRRLRRRARQFTNSEVVALGARADRLFPRRYQAGTTIPTRKIVVPAARAGPYS